jgi:UTP-glucose-1-phosphate uridylyltransferase
MIDVFHRVAARSCWSSACRWKAFPATASWPSTSPRPRPWRLRIADLVEKPRREDAPSNLAIIGRYILTPDIFPSLEATPRDKSGEIQLTNGLRHLLKSRPLYACEVTGVRHDTGNKLGFLKALVYFALATARPGRAVQTLPGGTRREGRRRGRSSVA